MKDIAIYGAGGFGREVACLLSKINEKTPQWNLIGFFDDVKSKGDKTEYGVVLGGINDLNGWDKPLAIAIAIGSPRAVKAISGKIKNPHIEFPNIFAPDVVLLDKHNITFGRGNIICMKCFFSCNVQIGDFNIFNGLITVGHDAKIGNYNSMMPAVRISGNVIVGDCNFFGVDAVVLQQIEVGNNTVVGSNSVIIRKTKDGNTYMGNPATIVKY